MGPHRVDAAILHDDDLIGIHDRGNPLRNNDLGHVGELSQRSADFAFGSGIYRAGGIIEDKNFGMLEKGSGNA